LLSIVIHLQVRVSRVGGCAALDESKIERIREMKSVGRSIVAISKELKVNRGSDYQYI